MKVVEKLLDEVQNTVGEYAFATIAQVVFVRFWKRMLIAAVFFAWGVMSALMTIYTTVRDLSLEKMISDHPLTALLITIFVLWFITEPVRRRN